LIQVIFAAALDARDQFIHVKRLHDIVARPFVQSGNAIIQPAARRKDEDRRLVSASLHLVEHGKTVRIGKSKIEDDGGIAHRLQRDFGGSRIAGRVDVETGSRQRLRQKNRRAGCCPRPLVSASPRASSVRCQTIGWRTGLVEIARVQFPPFVSLM